ncbi:MAG: 1-deoxy-D-xylulose-5-phosphate reductoisomerase [Planctomycetota bacterium]|nr:1-deoxy-D-xylulose-5-phosphate reductoisomerase [Planctomycetota bacterium]
MPAPPLERRLIILGSTGSIGVQTLEVVRHLNDLHARGQHPVRWRVVGLAAGSNEALAHEQARAFDVPRVALATGSHAQDGKPARGYDLRIGPDEARRLVAEVECDLVMAAIVGSAGLSATLEAVRRGRDVALANKETLVAAGGLVVPEAQRTGAKLLPVDSEHSALWQCLRSDPGAESGPGSPCPPMRASPSVARVILTASGGAFRDERWTKDLLESATVEQALKHPTWTMGRKVTIDSASLANKALEIIEAGWLFGLEPARIGVVVHPQSIVHSLVEYRDGNTLAQCAPPDMRTPILHAMCFPDRPAGLGAPLPRIGTWEFREPDLERFPLLKMGWRVLERADTTLGAIFNAANEAAVETFLAGKVTFGAIPRLVERAVADVPPTPLRSLDDVARAERAARASVMG